MSDPVRTTRIVMICGLAALWFLALVCLALSIWVAPDAINPALGFAFVAAGGTIFFVPAYIRDRRKSGRG